MKCINGECDDFNANVGCSLDYKREECLSFNPEPEQQAASPSIQSAGSTRPECKRCNHWPVCKPEMMQNLEGDCSYFEPGRVSEIVGYIAELRCVLDQLYSRRRIPFGDMRPPYMTKEELKSEYVRGDALTNKISEMVRSIY